VTARRNKLYKKDPPTTPTTPTSTGGKAIVPENLVEQMLQANASLHGAKLRGGKDKKQKSVPLKVQVFPFFFVDKHGGNENSHHSMFCISQLQLVKAWVRCRFFSTKGVLIQKKNAVKNIFVDWILQAYNWEVHTCNHRVFFFKLPKF
jgi:hypothetical protein